MESKDKIDEICAPSEFFKRYLNSLLDSMTLYSDIRDELFKSICTYVEHERGEAAHQYFTYVKQCVKEVSEDGKR